MPWIETSGSPEHCAARVRDSDACEDPNGIGQERETTRAGDEAIQSDRHVPLSQHSVLQDNLDVSFSFSLNFDFYFIWICLCLAILLHLHCAGLIVHYHQHGS